MQSALENKYLLGLVIWMSPWGLETGERQETWGGEFPLTAPPLTAWPGRMEASRARGAWAYQKGGGAANAGP